MRVDRMALLDAVCPLMLECSRAILTFYSIALGTAPLASLSRHARTVHCEPLITTSTVNTLFPQRVYRKSTASTWRRFISHLPWAER